MKHTGAQLVAGMDEGAGIGRQDGLPEGLSLLPETASRNAKLACHAGFFQVHRARG